VYVEIIQLQNRRQSNVQKTLQQELHNLSQGAPVLGLAKSTY